MASTTLLLPTLARCRKDDPRWSQLLGRADRLDDVAAGLSAQLASVIVLEDAAPLPWAAILAQDEGVQAATDSRWLALEPLSLRVAPNGVYVVASNDFGQTHEEMAALWSSVQDLLTEDGLRLHPGRGYRAFLQLSEAETDPATVTAEDLLGVELTGWFPAQRLWRRRLNELQIVWSQHPVNERRSARGQLPINSPWFGSAAVWHAPPPARPNAIFTTDPLLTAIARWCGAAVSASAHIATTGTALLDLRDQAGLALDLLQTRITGLVHLHFACGARFALRRWHRLRFWRGGLESAST